MKSLFRIFILCLFFLNIYSPKTEAKKIGYKFPVKESKKEKNESQHTGSFKVDLSSASKRDNDQADAGENEFSSLDNDGGSAQDIIFSGFDKKLSSDNESFFITNKTDRVLTAIELEIEYLTPDGRQLDKKFHDLRCNIPAGETRKIDIKTWDKQHSFYYHKTPPARGGGSPFTVRFYPQAYYLKY